MKHLSRILGVLAVLLACALPLAAQTATPSPTATATKTPTSTPTFTPSPLQKTPRYIPFNPATTGGFQFRMFRVPLDASYPAGGWLITPANFGFKVIEYASFNPVAGAANTGLILTYDYTNNKLKCYMGTATAVAFTECSGAEGSGLTTRALIIGYQ